MALRPHVLALLILSWLAAFAFPPTAQAEPYPVAGVAYPVAGLPVPVELSLPENHTPSGKWPAVFFYHGTNGKPATHMIRQHTGPRDWIVVGMTYSQAGAFQSSPENIQKELGILHRTRDELASKYGLDPARVYVAGFSMGGWVSDLFLQADRSLAGGVIMAAGHMQDLTPKPAPFRAGLPVYIGIGRLDPNYPFGLRARLFYQKNGAVVNMETWDGIGHDYPRDGAVGLKEWFALRKGASSDEAAVQAEYDKLAQRPPLEGWKALLEFRERPYVTALGAPWKERLTKRLAELEQDPAVTREATVYKRHRQLLADEINAKTLPELEKAVAAYALLAQEAEGTSAASLIAADHARMAKLVASFQAQQAEREKANPRPASGDSPKPERTIPKNPLVR